MENKKSALFWGLVEYRQNRAEMNGMKECLDF